MIRMTIKKKILRNNKNDYDNIFSGIAAVVAKAATTSTIANFYQKSIVIFGENTTLNSL